MSGTEQLLAQARDSYGRRDWVAARDHFSAASGRAPLGADDLYAFGYCHWWLGALEASLAVFRQAHRAYAEAGRAREAAAVALDLGYCLALRGDHAQASGWMGRAVRLLEEEPDCVERGFLVYVDFEDAFDRADFAAALDRSHAVLAAGRRFAQPTLLALGVLAHGRTLVAQGRVAEGMALLDEAMVAAVSDDLDPSWAGHIYCHLMLACYELADWRRAAEWTDAIARWCEAMPGAGPFMGVCRVYRAHVLQVRGVWDEAEAEASRVCEELAHVHVAMAGEAHYQLGDLRRRRGDWAGAEAAFAAAHRCGRDPQPGLARLGLAQGRAGSGLSGVERALDAVAPDDRLARARLLPAVVECAIAAGDLERAHEAGAELDDTARAYGTTGLSAEADRAAGAVLLASGAAEEAVAPLRASLAGWRELDALYETALVRLLLARAFAALGAHDAAALEERSARAELDRLGAAPPTPAQLVARTDGLTPREGQVLDLVAQGMSNQQIASELVLSIRTVERHLATVYRKLGLRGPSARAAAVRHALGGGTGRGGDPATT